MAARRPARMLGARRGAAETPMEEQLLRAFASQVALAAELVSVLVVALGGIVTLARLGLALRRGRLTDHATRKAIFVGFAGWIILALEFALGADIVRSAIAPTWDDIGQLAAIAAIRTFLNFFLERDVEAYDARRRPD
jgi:uncharacterized membrane protein